MGELSILSDDSMKLLDRYIIKQFLLTAFFGIIAFTVIFVVIDLMEKLDDFLDKRAAATIIVQYYLDQTHDAGGDPPLQPLHDGENVEQQ